jgi:putative hemolysin
VLTAMHGLLAAARSAFASVRHSRLRQVAAEAGKRGQLALRLVEDASRLLGSLYLGKALLATLAAAVAALWLVGPLATVLNGARGTSGWALALALFLVEGALAGILLMAGRLVPEAVAASRAERWSLTLAPLVYALEVVLWPFVRLMVWLSNLLVAPFGGTPFSGTALITEEEIKTLVDAGEEEGVIEEEEKEMIYSIFEFGDTLAREVMVPRMDIVALDADASLQEALDLIISAGHSRIPVFEGSVDHILGVLYAKDLLSWLRDEREGVSLREILRPAYFVPETKKVDDLLREMQQRRVHITILVDEYGGTAGLVTVEDILEEIVGEIQDEYDREEPAFEKVADGEYVLDARMSLDDVNDLLGTHLPAEAGDTLGGFVYTQLGKVPQPGETFPFDGLLIEVLTVSGRRIRKVRVRLTQTEKSDAGV